MLSRIATDSFDVADPIGFQAVRIYANRAATVFWPAINGHGGHTAIAGKLTLRSRNPAALSTASAPAT
jgi:hypothetical protein